MKVDRLINDPHWNELPDLITEFFKNTGCDRFFCFSDEGRDLPSITLDIIDEILYYKMEGHSFTDGNFLIEQSRRSMAKGCRSSITLEDALKMIPLLNLDEIKSNIIGRFVNYLANCDQSKTTEYEKSLLLNYHLEEINNLHQVFTFVTSFSHLYQFHINNKNDVQFLVGNDENR